MLRVLTGCAAVLLLTACGGDGSALDGEFRCSFFFRESSEQPSFEEQVLAIPPNQDVVATLGKLDLKARFSSDQFEGNAFSLSVAAGETSVWSALYQFGDTLPENQFAGGHGFTGLIYLTHPSEGGDYQLFCESVP